MIPLEDITHMSFKSEFTKAIQADIESEVIPHYGLSENCCDQCHIKCCSLCDCCCKLFSCCCRKPTQVGPDINTTTVINNTNTNHQHANYEEVELPLPKDTRGCCTRLVDRFRCWCCRRTMLVKLTKRTNTQGKAEAKRVVTMSVEYSKYNNLDAPSHTRLISEADRFAYFKSKFDPHIEQKFYLVSNTDFDSSNFKLIREQAEHLCRVVMQLKAMRNGYPNEEELDKILDQSHMRVYGVESAEATMQLESTLVRPAIAGAQPYAIAASPPKPITPPRSAPAEHSATSE